MPVPAQGRWIREVPLEDVVNRTLHPIGRPVILPWPLGGEAVCYRPPSRSQLAQGFALSITGDAPPIVAWPWHHPDTWSSFPNIPQTFTEALTDALAAFPTPDVAYLAGYTLSDVCGTGHGFLDRRASAHRFGMQHYLFVLCMQFYRHATGSMPAPPQEEPLDTALLRWPGTTDQR